LLDLQPTLNKEKVELKQAEETKRILQGRQKTIIAIVAVAFALFQIYVNSIRPMPATLKNACHLGFLLVLAFTLYPAGKKSPRDRFTASDAILALVGGAAALYIFVNYEIIHMVRGSIPITRDYVVGIVTIIVLLEAARRTMGPIVPLLAIFFLAYLSFGLHFPGMFAHRGFLWTRIVYRMCYTYEGILGITIGVSATYIFLFILFGAFLKKSGATDLFNDLSMALAGNKRGGPAQVAVISSGLMGTVSGSAVANVATTGSVTIPMMKNIGYTPQFAGAVEAAASTGGHDHAADHGGGGLCHVFISQCPLPPHHHGGDRPRPALLRCCEHIH